MVFSIRKLISLYNSAQPFEKIWIASFFLPKSESFREFLGSPVVKTLHSHCPGPGSISGLGTKIPQQRVVAKKKANKKVNHSFKQIHIGYLLLNIRY